MTTVTALCVLIDIAEGNLDRDDALETLFHQRSKGDWEKVWHQESHSRCREKLIRHLYWACEKDIYRLSRRNGFKQDENAQQKRSGIVVGAIEPYPWISSESAHTLLRFRRNDKASGSITSECCTRAGCTWEEYAEYCPSNKRLNQYSA